MVLRLSLATGLALLFFGSSMSVMADQTLGKVITLLQSTKTVTVSANNETEALVKIQRQNPGWAVESIRRIGNTNNYQARLRKQSNHNA